MKFDIPEVAKVRRVPRVRMDGDNEIIEIVDEPATYYWELMNKAGRLVRDINADNERTDRVLRRMFYGREEGDTVFMLRKVGADGETQWGPQPI